MKRTQRPLVLRLIDALFPRYPTIPPTKRATAHKYRKPSKLSSAAKRKPKEPKP